MQDKNKEQGETIGKRRVWRKGKDSSEEGTLYERFMKSLKGS